MTRPLKSQSFPRVHHPRAAGALAIFVTALTLSASGWAGGPPTAAPSPLEPPGRGHAVSEDEPRIEARSVRGSSIERVRGTIAVSAPLERLRRVVFDFPRYPEFMAHYTKATLLGTTADGGGAVRLEIAELGGAIRLWMRIRVSAPVTTNGVDVYTGRLEDGNVKAFQGRWELSALTPERTRLRVESFMDPGLSLVPSSLVNQGAREGVRDALLALKARAESSALAAR